MSDSSLETSTDDSAPRVVELTLPNLGLGDLPVTLTVWHVKTGQPVTIGDRLVEVVAGSVTVDLPSPVSGVMRKILVPEDDPLNIGQVLALLTVDPEQSDDD